MPKFATIIWVRRLKRKGEKFFKSKDILTFSLFLLLSSSFWFVNALSSNRQADLELSVLYKGIPQGVKFINKLPNTIQITVADDGVKLFEYNKSKLQTIEIDLSDRINPNDAILFISAQEIENLIASTLLPTTDLISFSPEYLSSDYVHLTYKKVAVAIAVEASPAPQYVFTSAVKTIPDSIEILGAQQDIDPIDRVWTEYTQLNNIKKSVFQTLELQEINDIQLSQPSVTLQIDVDRFTEKNINLPITFKHVPDSINVRTFPAKINATFNVSMNQFNNIAQEDLQLIFDFDDLKKSDVNKYKIKVKNNKPHIISNLKIIPEEVEFLLETK